MKLGTILVHLDYSEHCAGRVGIAATLARQHGSHLIGLVPTGLYDGVIPAEAIAGKDTDFIAASADFLRVRAEGIAHTFRKLIEGAPSISSEVRLVDQPSVDAVVLHGRTSDLVIVGQSQPGDTDTTTARDLPEQVVLHAGRPVLVLPRAKCARELGKNVLVAWDGSREAAIALRDALLLLSKAASVALVSWRASAAPVDDSDLRIPQILAWLRRHGIEAKAVQHVASEGLADALLSHAAREDAGLVVMGGYGHTRIRELVLGSVTRGIFERMDVPILMAH
ncbi:universal stress protein [Variovorax sp. J31P207]|uniref:universal stress protein n=1 Tax=Variovorax sp. J31P207 TaxID=3053510 RepID=UPI002578A93C|nr:universal stress protein [Variovorax sp. J31P207]MDM0065051.1 universal stress protein [Variovorax sp. J31P207]